eukprot:3322190-Rhodomonas_salina.2
MVAAPKEAPETTLTNTRAGAAPTSDKARASIRAKWREQQSLSRPIEEIFRESSPPRERGRAARQAKERLQSQPLVMSNPLESSELEDRDELTELDTLLQGEALQCPFSGRPMGMSMPGELSVAKCKRAMLMEGLHVQNLSAADRQQRRRAREGGFLTSSLADLASTQHSTQQTQGSEDARGSDSWGDVPLRVQMTLRPTSNRAP